MKYSRLATIVDGKKGIKKKTHNNIVSVIRRAFEYGYLDSPEKHNPASAPAEQIALLVDRDLRQGKIKVSKACVMERDKDRTKTGEDRVVELCPRALEVLKRQLALRARLKLGKFITICFSCVRMARRFAI